MNAINTNGTDAGNAARRFAGARTLTLTLVFVTLAALFIKIVFL
jgi:hypothetical protein